MSGSSSSAYYRAREQQERALAERADDPAVAKLHLEMAQRYSDLVTEHENIRAGPSREERENARFATVPSSDALHPPR